MLAAPGTIVRKILLTSVRFYQRYLSFLLSPACRFQPSCSHYVEEALHRKRLHVALGLIVWRLMRCQPFCKGGYDPVPPDGEGSPKSNGTSHAPDSEHF